MENKIKRRRGKITLVDAQKKFNEYYNLKHWDKPVGQKRAKLFDMMYQKKEKYTLVPGEPGSERYLLEEGPKTFDMVGVDHFPEGERQLVPESNITVKSKGATYIQKEDSDDMIDGKIGDAHPEVYGPRKNNKRLFNKYFKEMYDDNQKNNFFENQLNKNDVKNKDRNNLVDIYWEQYRNGKSGTGQSPHKRKNKKNTLTKFGSHVNQLRDDELKDYSAIEYKDDIYLIEDESGEVYIKKEESFIMVYKNILNDLVPEGLKKIAFNEKILIQDSTGKYTINSGELLMEMQNVKNGEYIYIYSNNRIYIYDLDDDDEEQIILQEDILYDSLEEYIEINRISHNDLIDITDINE